MNDAIITDARQQWYSGRSLLFMGHAGTGKTWAARHIINSSLRVIPCPRIVEAYAESGREGIMDILRGEYCLDDLGQEAPHFGRELLADVICEREANHAQTIITTNFTLEQLAARYGDRIHSRLCGWCDHYLFSGRDLRQPKEVPA